MASTARALKKLAPPPLVSKAMAKKESAAAAAAAAQVESEEEYVDATHSSLPDDDAGLVESLEDPAVSVEEPLHPEPVKDGKKALEEDFQSSKDHPVLHPSGL